MKRLRLSVAAARYEVLAFIPGSAGFDGSGIVYAPGGQIVALTCLDSAKGSGGEG
ncbi:hypothetical protein AB0B56_25645 [Streptosporangium canum]|uniref:Uncharacterized protein n=1 Tax=Streptosporangium canum TaxID=324952 RepID=A0A1I3WGZ0_9ACTN|nr:hypothetical protein [Streptosporangium canum]SFK06828.1 hypothetical protein SAMN05216275_116143 [Streptosporangium canum]